MIEFEVDMNNTVMEGPLGEYTGYYTPASLKPVAKITAITHRKKPIFQGLLTGKPVTENHILKQIPFEASFLRTLKAQFPTVKDVSVRASAGVSFFVVISMTPRFKGEPRQVILNAMSSNIRPKWTVIVEPDIDVHNSAEVEWAMAFRTQPQEDVIIVGDIPAGPSDPSIDDPKVARPMRVASAIGVDAHAAVRQAVLGGGGRAGLGGIRDAGARRVAVEQLGAHRRALAPLAGRGDR